MQRWFLGVVGAAILIASCKTEKVATTEVMPPPQQQAVESNIVGEEVTYTAGNTTLKGFLAYDKAKPGPRPGVLVVHEWWGHNDYARSRAKALAAMGYTALAVDMYGDGKNADHPEDAQKFATEVMSNMPEAMARFEAGKKLLESHVSTNPEKIAAIGYCFGGAVVLQMARSGVDLDAVASFHGMLMTHKPAAEGQIKGKVFVATGEADPMVPPEHVAAFKKEMADAKVSLELLSFPNVQHAFTNPNATEMGKKFGLPLAYDANADEKSWAALDTFLQGVFGPRAG